MKPQIEASTADLGQWQNTQPWLGSPRQHRRLAGSWRHFGPPQPLRAPSRASPSLFVGSFKSNET